RGWDFKIIVGRVLGWNWLKSSRFEITRAGSNLVFHGSGFGHGLGLCQEGAHVMAARGVSHERILEKYFPGTRVGKGTAASPPHRDTVSFSITGRWRADILLRTQPNRVSASSRPRHSVSVLRFVTIASEHFRVTYPADLARREADQVLNIL